MFMLQKWINQSLIKDVNLNSETIPRMFSESQTSENSKQNYQTNGDVLTLAQYGAPAYFNTVTQQFPQRLQN